MWFKLFVLLHMPVSFFCLLGIGYATGLKLWDGPLWGWRGRWLGRALLSGAYSVRGKFTEPENEEPGG
jgi:hypothetical protein